MSVHGIAVLNIFVTEMNYTEDVYDFGISVTSTSGGTDRTIKIVIIVRMYDACAIRAVNVTVN